MKVFDVNGWLNLSDWRQITYLIIITEVYRLFAIYNKRANRR